MKASENEVVDTLDPSPKPVVSDLHVLTLTPFYPTDRDDAEGCFVSEPLAWLAKYGITNTVFAVRPVYRGRVRAPEIGVPAQWFRYFALPRSWGLPSAGAFVFSRILGRVRDLNSRHPIDVIHAHGPLPCGHAAMLLSRELNLPYVVSVHGLDAFSAQLTGKAGRWCFRISRHVFRSARRVICISERVREKVLEGEGRNCRTSVVYNGVDPALFSPAEPPPGGAPTILSVGNLIPTKGHALLLRAAKTLSSEFRALRWEIIGDGPEHPRLAALAQALQVSDRVAFLGRQSRKQVATAMQRCTLFALPSSYEGLGCVYLEAMSTGKPVIGCRGQGIADIVRHGTNGFLVGPDNEKELALAIAMLLRSESLRRNLGRTARDTILERLTLDHQAEQLARIYRESVA